MANVFALEIVTPDKTFYNGNAEMIVVRTTEGDRGILKNHRPLVAGLATGTLRIKLDGKFKDAKNLLNAYNSLQAEFTRKSQKLAEFEKENTKNAVFEQQENLDVFLNRTGNDEYKKDIEEILNSDDELSNLPNKYQVATKIIKEAKRKSADTLNDHNFIDEYILKNENKVHYQ